MSGNGDVVRIGRRIREARKMASLSQTELARAVGYSAANPISKLENGRTASVDLVLLEKIAKTTGVPLHQLTGTDATDPQDRGHWRRLLAGQSRQTVLLERLLERMSQVLERLDRARPPAS